MNQLYTWNPKVKMLLHNYDKKHTSNEQLMFLQAQKQHIPCFSFQFQFGRVMMVASEHDGRE